MNKKQKKNLTMYSITIVIIASIILLAYYSTPASITGTGNNTNGSSGGGGGGGSYTTGGNSNTGTTPPDDGFLCNDCDAFFFEGNPGIVTSKIRDPNLFQRAFVQDGHWNCEGDCIYNGVNVSSTYNCVPDPTQEMPEGGWDDINGERPNCWCLERNPGTCAWYDGNYGQGIDNLQCGGSCPMGQVCSSWVEGDKQICNCTLPQDVVECGFHINQTNTLMMPSMDDYEKSCYGWCEEEQNNDCRFWVDENEQPRCGCANEQNEQEKTPCENVDVSDGQVWKCWTQGECTTGNECVYDQFDKKCECQGTNECGWHITVEQAQQLQQQFDNIQDAVNYILDNIDLYCYGNTCMTTEECKFNILADANGNPIFDCGCYAATNPQNPEDQGLLCAYNCMAFGYDTGLQMTSSECDAYLHSSTIIEEGQYYAGTNPSPGCCCFTYSHDVPPPAATTYVSTPVTTTTTTKTSTLTKITSVFN